MKTRRPLLIIAIVVTVFAMSVRPAYAAKAKLSSKNLTLTVGETAKLTVKNAKGVKVKWGTTNRAIATVSKGKVTARSAGTAKIIAKVGKKKLVCKVSAVEKTVVGAQEQAPAASASEPQNTNSQILPDSEEESHIRNRILAMKANYPDGMPWTNANYYQWQGGTFAGGYGCAAFAFMLSDAAFGDAPAHRHTDVNSIKIGDCIRTDNDTHMGIVLYRTETGFIVAEGNYNRQICWGREVKKETVNYVITRY